MKKRSADLEKYQLERGKRMKRLFLVCVASMFVFLIGCSSKETDSQISGQQTAQNQNVNTTVDSNPIDLNLPPSTVEEQIPPITTEEIVPDNTIPASSVIITEPEPPATEPSSTVAENIPGENVLPITGQITITLAPESPSGNIAPGDRLLAILNINNTQENATLYGVKIQFVNNGPGGFVDKVIFETANNQVALKQTQQNSSNFELMGFYRVPLGDSKLYLKGHVTNAGLLPDDLSIPVPVLTAQMNFFATTQVTESLISNQLMPRYSNYGDILTSLTLGSPAGLIPQGIQKVLEFKIQTNVGTGVIDNIQFYYTPFNGYVDKCSLKLLPSEELLGGLSLLSYQKPYYQDPRINISFDKYNMYENNHIMEVTTEPITVGLYCDLNAFGADQSTRFYLRSFYLQPVEGGYYYKTQFNGIPPLVTGHTLWLEY